MVPTAPAGQASMEDILAIEQRTWRTHGAKARAIYDLGLTGARYYQLLSEMIDTPEALMADPGLVNRLREQRARRLALRTGRDCTCSPLPGQACRAAAACSPGRTGLPQARPLRRGGLA